MPVSFLNDPVFRNLGKVASVEELSPSQRRAYDHSLKIYRDNYAIAQTERAEGYAEGRAEGYAEGEKKAMINIAKRLLGEGSDPDYVKNITELTDVELASI